MSQRLGHGALQGLIAFLALLSLSAPLRAESSTDAEDRFAVHGQFTYVEQETDGFAAPYAGRNSLTPSMGRETTDLTLSLGARLWQGAEFWVMPEIDQGFGLDDTTGVAGFPSGEAYKVGRNHPYYRLTRAFLRDTVNLGDASESVAPGLFQFGGKRSEDRLVFTVGKFSVPDLFDNNQYAHDPRGDFLNWSLIDAGTFDYAADAWGYTIGAAAEWYTGAWTLRAGGFDLSNVPNSEVLDHNAHQFELVAELERRYAVLGHDGKFLVTAYDNRGRMGLLADALREAQLTDTVPDVAAVRRYRSRLGLSFSLEQSLSDHVGFFARGGQAAGNVEAYEFTEIDRTLAAGLAVAGTRWGRSDDRVGVAVVNNAISAVREAYLAAGGLGILVGDGQLPHPGAEHIAELYYALSMGEHLTVTGDYQYVANPAYNRDRGPVSLFALRVHLQL